MKSGHGVCNIQTTPTVSTTLRRDRQTMWSLIKSGRRSCLPRTRVRYLAWEWNKVRQTFVLAEDEDTIPVVGVGLKSGRRSCLPRTRVRYLAWEWE